MAIQKIKRTRAYEGVVQQISDAISSGAVQPGDRLPPERELAKAFGVARPTLRQALTILAQAGVVEILPGCGVYLRKPMNEAAPGEAGSAMAMVLITEKQNLPHILELRTAIEGEAAYLAALRRTPEHVEKLMQATGGFSSEEDFQFHSMIAEATGNPVFVKVLTSLADLFMQQVESNRSLYSEAALLPALQREHEEILKAIADQRPDDARKAMIRHLQSVTEGLRRTNTAAAC